MKFIQGNKAHGQFKKWAVLAIACADVLSLVSFMNIQWRSLLLCAGVLSSCATAPESETKPMGIEVLDRDAIHAAKRGPVSFVTHVKPVLEAKCVTCHNRKTLPGHASLETRDEALRTGVLGTYAVPGHPEKSLLVHNVESTHRNASVMPAVGMRLTAAEYHILKKWVKEGAIWPAGREGVLHYVP